MLPFSDGYDPTDERMEAATLDQECPFAEPPTNADRIRSMSDENKRNAMIDYFSQWAGIGDSYIYDLGRVKEAFGLGTMNFDDFTEWDVSRVAELVDELLDWLRQPAEDK